MKQKLLILFFALAASVGIAFAATYSGTCGTNLTWTLENGTLTISGTGTMKNYTSSNVPWYSYRSFIKTITIKDGVTTIGEDAFENCSSLLSVTIPNSVTTIGNYAFGNCSSLTSVTLGSSVTSIGEAVFWNCNSLTFIEIPNSVTSIGDYAFYGCSSLTSIEIPNSITSIGNYAFIYCSSLTSIIVESGNTKYDSRNNCNAIIATATNTLIAGCKNTIVPNSVTSIGESAFCGCSNLTSVTIPNSVTSIGDYAFCNCSSLTSVAIPNNVTTIGKDAFYGCSSLPVIGNIRYADMYLVGAVDKTLSSYTIKDGTNWIGNNAFSDCSSLTSIIIPNSIKCIGDTAFSNCRNLTSITIPNSVTSIGNYAFYGCNGLTSVTIGKSVTSIGYNAFPEATYTCQNCSIKIYKRRDVVKKIKFTGSMEEWCAKSFSPNYISESYTLYINDKVITDAVIPSSITRIGNYAFGGCSSLTSVTIPNSVTNIGSSAFYACTNLTSITIPNSVTSIENSAFAYCSSLTSVTIPNSVTTIGNYTFCNCSNLTSVTIPNSVTSIGYFAFLECSKLTSVTMESTTPPEVGDYIFPSLTIIYVPLGSLNTYKASNWKNYDIRVFDLRTDKGKEYSTSATVTINASLNGENKNKYIKSCGVDGGNEEFSGNTAEYIGLEPNSEYQDVPFFIKTTKGDVQSITASFTTSALTLTTLQSKAVSSNTAILLAETNMSDLETSCGFEWRRNNQPEDMPSNQVLCPVANGLLAGRLKGLKDDVYYKYRAFYKSAAGNMYYGDWQYIFTGDATVQFEPVLYTYAAQFVSERKATLKGYALAGSDDFTEQGFEYWAESRNSSHAPRRAPLDAIGEKHTVTGSGISMQVTLENLDEGTVYKYRTYAKTGNKTLYGGEMTFTTDGEWKYTLTVSTGDDKAGTVTGGGKYAAGSEVTIEAVAKDGYDFVRWSDGNTDNPRTITVHDDAEYTAVFKAKNPSSLTETELENAKVRKYISNGILYIKRNGITYTAQGQRLD